MPLQRNLFRLLAIVPEQGHHRIALELARAKAMDVQWLPVDPYAGDEAKPQRGGGTGKAGRPSVRTSLIALARATPEFSNADVKATLPNVKPGSIDQALAALANEGALERTSPGRYRVANLPAVTNGGGNGAAPPTPKSVQVGGRPSAFVLALFSDAPDHTLKRGNIIERVKEAGGNAASVTGVIDRLVRDKKIKRLSQGTYQLRT